MIVLTGSQDLRTERSCPFGRVVRHRKGDSFVAALRGRASRRSSACVKGDRDDLGSIFVEGRDGPPQGVEGASASAQPRTRLPDFKLLPNHNDPEKWAYALKVR